MLPSYLDYAPSCKRRLGETITYIMDAITLARTEVGKWSASEEAVTSTGGS